MATDQDFADYVLEQLRDVPRVQHRKMFGEYAVYANDRVVALLCDNQLFVRPTNAGRAVIDKEGTLKEAPPYPGAKLHFLIEGELEDTAFLARLIAATLTEVPLPKPKKSKAAEGAKGKASAGKSARVARKKPAPKK